MTSVRVVNCCEPVDTDAGDGVEKGPFGGFHRTGMGGAKYPGEGVLFSLWPPSFFPIQSQHCVSLS